MNDKAANKELVITRTFDAPRKLVYRAFTDPDQLSQWFGPVGFSVPRDTVEVDAKVGGPYRLTMVNDDDPTERSPIIATLTEVIENELLVGVEESEGLQLRIELYDEGGKTRLVLRQGPFTQEMLDMTREGWESSFTKLDTLLTA